MNEDEELGLTAREDMSLPTAVLRRRLGLRFLRDAVIFLVLGVPLLIVHVAAPTYQRGFFCDDDSIRYPFKASTISSAALQLVTIGGSVIVILATEFVVVVIERRLSNPAAQAKVVFHHTKSLYRLIVRGYTFIGFFVFGMVLCQWLTVGGKKTIGRLRPHYIDACRPNISLSACATSHTYLVEDCDYVCTWRPGLSAYFRDDSRHSFPSGHASAAFFTAVFLAMYLESRLRQPLWRPLALPAVQFLFLLLAFLTGLSRVSDYKHHPTDVLSGGLIGALSAFLTVKYIGRLFEDQAEVRYKFIPKVSVSQPRTLPPVRSLRPTPNSPAINDDDDAPTQIGINMPANGYANGASTPV